MPRITRRQAQEGVGGMIASMRPGRNAPDNASGLALVGERGPASMRPGRNAPDNHRLRGGPGERAAASMRPGRNAPDNAPTISISKSSRMLQ